MANDEIVPNPTLASKNAALFSRNGVEAGSFPHACGRRHVNSQDSDDARHTLKLKEAESPWLV
jgi:hypothetical protein